MWRILTKAFISAAYPIEEDLRAMRSGALHADEFRDRALRLGYTPYGIRRLIERSLEREEEAIAQKLEADIAAVVHR